MRLSSNEQLVLSAVCLSPDDSLTAIRERTGLREHQIHYLLSKLKDDGVVLSVPFIDFSRIGFIEYKVYFSLLPQHFGTRDQIRELVSCIPQVVWFGELGGRYELGMDVVGNDPLVVQELLEKLSARIGSVVTNRTMLCTTSFSVFQKIIGKHERLFIEKRQSLKRERARVIVDVDDLDKTILGLLNKHGAVSHRELSRLSGIPRTTIDSRVQRLRREGVIVGYRYLISGTKLDLRIFKVLIRCNQSSQDIRLLMRECAIGIASVTNLTECVGAWDFEVTVESSHREEVINVVSTLSAQLGTVVRDVEVLTVFTQFQPRTSLFTLNEVASLKAEVA